MERISHLLPKVLKRRGLHEHAVAAYTVRTAQQWIDQELPNFQGELAVRSLKDSALLIDASNSIAAQECYARSDDLLAHIRGVHPEVHIERMHLSRV
jgi:hypothetical protein